MPTLPKVFYGWYIVVMAFCTSAITGFANVYLFAVVQVPMAESLGVPRSVLLGVVAVRTVVSVIVSPFAGRIVDKPWGAKAILAIGGTLAGTATILCGFVTAVWQLYLLMVCVTVAAAGVDLLGAALVSRWFRRKRGRALGLTTMGSSAGSILLVPLGTVLVNNLGWQAAWFLAGGLLLSVTLTGGLLVVKPNPASMGLVPDGEPEPVSEGSSARRQSTRSWTAKEAVRTPALWLMTFTGNTCGFVITAFLFNMPAVAVSPAASAAALTFFAFGTGGSRPLWGYVADRFSHRKIYFVTLLGLGACLGMVPFFRTSALMLPLSCLIGIFYGANQPLLNLTLTSFYGTDHYGSIMGMTRPVSAIFSVLAPIVPAALLDATGSFTLVFLGLTSLTVVATVMVYFARDPRPDMVPAGLPLAR